MPNCMDLKSLQYPLIRSYILTFKKRVWNPWRKGVLNLLELTMPVVCSIIPAVVRAHQLSRPSTPRPWGFGRPSSSSFRRTRRKIHGTLRLYSSSRPPRAGRRAKPSAPQRWPPRTRSSRRRRSPRGGVTWTCSSPAPGTSSRHPSTLAPP